MSVLRTPLRILANSATLFLAALPLIGYGQEPASEDVPKTIAVNVAPAAEPRPALQYRLLPAPHERLPGNATIFYYRAMLALKSIPADQTKEFDQKLDDWLAAPLDKLPKEDVRKLLGPGPMFAELKKAAYREHCDWDLRVQDLRGPDTIYLTLEDAQLCRTLSRRLQLRARLEMSEGRFADAFETLRQGYQLGQDVTRTPLLINGLIGIAITSVMNSELTKLSEASDVNYYWALAALPQPVISMRPALEYEYNMAFQVFPFLKDAETADRTPEEWQRLIVEALQLLPDLDLGGRANREPQWQVRLMAAALMAKVYPTAKRQLVEDGMPRERIEAMPVGQVVAIQSARSLRYAYDELFKLTYLPPAEGIRLSSTVQSRLKSEGFIGQPFSGREGLPLATMLLPALGAVQNASLRLERERAALQTIEALRMHAAATGKLPATLAEITVVPVPLNPATGQPLPYRLDAATGEATLDSPPSGGLSQRVEGKRYVVKLRK